MKMKRILLVIFILSGMLMFSMTAAFAVDSPYEGIMYQETAVQEGLWKYDYTFSNTSDMYLYSVRLEFGDFHNVSDAAIENNWGGFWRDGSNFFMEAYSRSYDDDIAPGDSLGGFTFTVNSQIGDVPFTAYFDDHEGARSYAAGLTALESAPPVVPEPVSSVLFITGGAALALRKRFKRKK